MMGFDPSISSDPKLFIFLRRIQSSITGNFFPLARGREKCALRKSSINYPQFLKRLARRPQKVTSAASKQFSRSETVTKTSSEQSTAVPRRRDLAECTRKSTDRVVRKLESVQKIFFAECFPGTREDKCQLRPAIKLATASVHSSCSGCGVFMIFSRALRGSGVAAT